MKAIFHKLFNTDRMEPASASPTLSNVHFADSLYDNQKNAMIGWIANRISQRLAGKQTYGRAEEQSRTLLLDLAAGLVDWLTEEKDVYLLMKQTHIPDPLYECLLETYEEMKDCYQSYLPFGNSKKAVEHSEEDEIWNVYRDVMFAATEGKLTLIRKEEIPPYKQGITLCQAVIKERADIPKARDLAKQSLIDIGLPQTAITGRLLVISEAITNILKHADDGRMSMIDANGTLHVIVEDRGPGFPLKLLPKTTLIAGYSTKKSLGQGFTLMRKMADKVLLSTSSGGTTIILVFEGKGVVR